MKKSSQKFLLVFLFLLATVTIGTLLSKRETFNAILPGSYWNPDDRVDAAAYKSYAPVVT